MQNRFIYMLCVIRSRAFTQQVFPGLWGELAAGRATEGPWRPAAWGGKTLVGPVLTRSVILDMVHWVSVSSSDE